MERTITIEEEGIYQEDYQIRMIQDNEVKGLLNVKGRGADEKSCYDYDVSGKTSLKAMFEKNEISAEDIRILLKNLMTVIEEAEKYLLDIHRILMEPEYIYYEDGSYYFCYYPPGHKNLWEAFHTLTEYFVKHADYKDKACVQMVFLLHKETMKENYSLEKIVTACLGQENYREGDAKARKEEEYGKKEEMEEMEEYKNGEYGGEYGNDRGYDRGEHDWIAEQEMGSSILKETENMWTPVKRLFNRHKKPRWGDWDGLYIEEEDL